MDLSKLLNDVADFALYSTIRNYIYARIELLMEQILSNNLTLTLTIVTSLFTLWIMIQGFLIITGRSQEGLKGFIFSLGKSYVIILMALGVSSNSSFALRALTETLNNGVSQIMMGNDSSGSKCLLTTTSDMLGCKIDKNLSVTQGVMGFMNQIDTADDPVLEEKVDKAKLFAGIGTAGPGIVAGTMLILYRLAMALFVGFAPIFILCLLFKKTAPLFSKWLYYGLATIFSSVMLAVMADISADLVEMMATSLFVSKGLLEFVTGQGVGGIAQAATQQLGLGLILSTLLITAPPMAGMWFNGVMGSFTPYSAFNGWNSSSSQALPPNMDGGRSMAEHRYSNSARNISENSPNIPNSKPDEFNTGNKLINGNQSSIKNSDTIKQYTTSELQNANSSANNHLPQPNTGKTLDEIKPNHNKGNNDEKA